VALRQEAIANNLANLETPGYKRVDLAPAFEQELSRACSANDGQQISLAETDAGGGHLGQIRQQGRQHGSSRV